MKNYLITLFFVSMSTYLLSQSDSLYGEVKTLSFARHLYNNNLFSFASEEYERLIFINPTNRIYHKELLSAYRKANNFDAIMKRSNNEYIKYPGIRLEYSLGLIATNKLTDAQKLFDEYDFSKDLGYNNTAIDIQNGISLLLHKKLKYTDSPNPIIYNISVMYSETKTKSATLAGVMSAIVPGSGRVYAKDNTNGLLSLLFIGGATWQAYSRFNKNGISSISGWVYGGFAFGFYLGNIYGSIKSAKKYNKNKFKEIDEQTKNYILNINF
jgi:hypothetical protein